MPEVPITKVNQWTGFYIIGNSVKKELFDAVTFFILIHWLTFWRQCCIKIWSFIKRQTNGTSSNNEWQRMTTIDNEWYNEWQGMTTSDNEWYNDSDNEGYNEWQRMTTSDNECCNKWQRVTRNYTTSDNEWQQIAMSDSEWQHWFNQGKQHSALQR